MKKKIKQRKKYKGVFSWNEPKIADGGRGHDLRDRAKFRDIKAKAFSSCYVGHVGVTFWVNNKTEAKEVADIIGCDLDYIHNGLEKEIT